MSTNKKYLVGVFNDEHTLVDASEKVLEKGVVIEEVYTPYPNSINKQQITLNRDIMITNKKYLIGVFNDEHTLVDAFEKALEKGVVIEEVYTPYPIHEILMGMKIKTRITYAAFFYGLFGVIALLGGMYYAAVIDWPLRFGGKPFNSFPSFIVVTIVATILIITILTLFTFSARSKVYPGKKADIIDERATNDKFIIVLDQGNMGIEMPEVTELFESHGASEVYQKEANSN